MFETFNYFRQHNDGNPIHDYKMFYKKFSNTREFGGDFSHMDHLVKNRFMDMLSYIFNIILRKRPDSILDIGCGLGMNLPLSRLLPGIEYHGLDYAEVSLEKARALYPDVKFHVGDAFAMPFQSAEYDLCIISSVLILYKQEHDQRALLTEAARVMKEDGVLVAVVWNDAVLLRWSIKLSRVIARIMGKNLPEDFMGIHFSNREIQRLSDSVGLEVRQLYNVCAEYGLLESIKYLSMAKYNRKFGASESPLGEEIDQNVFNDLLRHSGGARWLVTPMFILYRLMPSLFSMFTICVCKKR